jgi:hypothetical protein
MSCKLSKYSGWGISVYATLMSYTQQDANTQSKNYLIIVYSCKVPKYGLHCSARLRLPQGTFLCFRAHVLSSFPSSHSNFLLFCLRSRDSLHFNWFVIESKLLYDWQSSVSQYVLASSTLVGLATRYYFLSECCCLKFSVLYLLGTPSDERTGLQFAV